LIHRAVIIALGALLVLGAQTRCEAAGRTTIIQGVRDDVWRKIRADNERAAGPRATHAYGRQWHYAEPHHRR
jgi:hypothetical protein